MSCEDASVWLSDTSIQISSPAGASAGNQALDLLAYPSIPEPKMNYIGEICSRKSVDKTLNANVRGVGCACSQGLTDYICAPAVEKSCMSLGIRGIVSPALDKNLEGCRMLRCVQ
jgi:hypothetical protein